MAPPPADEEMEDMDIDAEEESEGGDGQENVGGEALNIMPTEEQADFYRPTRASRSLSHLPPVTVEFPVLCRLHLIWSTLQYAVV